MDDEELPAAVEPGAVVKVTVTGKGNYTGTADAYYRIFDTGKDISKMTFKIANKEYTGSAATIYKDAIFDTNVQDSLRHISTQNIKKSRAFTVLPVIPAEL